MFCLVSFCSVCAGCGYHPVVRDVESRFGEGKTVSIPIFANKTYKPNLENILLNDLIDEFAKRKGLRIEEVVASDYTLSGEVLTYGKVAISYTGYDIVNLGSFDLNATSVSFPGAADNFAIEDLVWHELDDVTLGLVTWTAGNVYVTPLSGSIQRV